MMRIENITAPKNWTENLSRPELSEGDVLIAEVADVRGDRVLLKNQNGGAAFSARLLSDISVAVGDFVETVVDEASGGRFVLRVLDISRQSPFATQTELTADMQAAGQAARAQALLGALAMLKNNPGADPKAAAFLSRHALGGAAENIEAVSQMAKGVSPLAALVFELAGIFGAGQPARDGQGMQSQAAQSQTGQSRTAQSQIEQSQTTQNQTAQSRTAQNQTEQSQTTQNQTEQSRTAQDLPAARQAQPLQNTPAAPSRMSGGSVPRDAVAPPAQGTTGMADAAVAGGGDGQNPAARAGQSAAVTRDARTDGMPDARAAQPRETQPGLADMPPVQAAPAQPLPGAAEQPNGSQAAPQAPPAPTQAQPIQPERPDVAPGAADETVPVRTPMPDGRTPIPEASFRTPPDAGAAVDREAKTSRSPQTDGERSRSARLPDEPLMQKALELLAVADDAEKLAAQLKKAVREMPEQLKELKLLARDADNIVREAVSSRLDMAEKQMALMSEVKRFDCYQIPLQTAAQQPATAELYVYRSRGGKKAVDPDNILILIGLDTPHMGRVETLIRTSGKSLGIEFNLEDMRLGDEMLAGAAPLKEAVNRAGYSLLGVSVKQLAARTTVLNAEARFEKDSGDSAGNLDVRI